MRSGLIFLPAGAETIEVSCGELIGGHRLIGPGPGDPWQELAVAVLLRAVRDSLTDPEAATWLRASW